MTIPTTLDIDLLRAFVTVATQKGFTSAGQTLGATQSAISLRVQRLEERLGGRLLDRSPQGVSLTDFGAEFLIEARRLLATHDEITMRHTRGRRALNFRLGVSDHAAGGALPQVLAGLARDCPDVLFSVTVLGSAEIYADYAGGAFDAAVVLRADGDLGGRTLFRDQLCWLSAAEYQPDPDAPVPLVTLKSNCAIRHIARTALQAAGVPWREVFLGTGVPAVQAAASAGLGIACLDRRNIPHDCRILTGHDWLPALPSTELVLHLRDTRPELRQIAARVGEAFGRLGAPG